MFSRLANLIKGFFSLFISGVERRNPEALLELEQENLRKQIANFNQGLATHAGLCERIMGQVRKLEAEQKDHSPPARGQQVGCRPIRAAPADDRRAARREPQAAGTG
jgi:phage shock protein A